MATFKIALYLLAALTSASCTLLLFARYAKHRVRLLLWSGLCFVGLTLNNVLLFLDLVLLPTADLRVVRLLASLGGMMFLLYGFVWDTDA